jgi:hypothetical protein
VFNASRRFQNILDNLTPYTAHRWMATAFVACIYFLRVFLAQGWYIVTVLLPITNYHTVRSRHLPPQSTPSIHLP